MSLADAGAVRMTEQIDGAVVFTTVQRLSDIWQESQTTDSAHHARVSGIIDGAVHNLIARWIGGIKVEVE